MNQPAPITSIARTASRERGFTLIEIMITVTIVGILVAVALPSYDRYVQRTHRSNAKNGLQQVAQWMERAATATGNYPRSNTVPSQIPPGILLVDGNRYEVTVVSNDGQVFVATATPQGRQVGDECGNLTLNQAGARGVVGGTLTAEECWRR